MAKRSKTREITIVDEGGAFNILKRITGGSHQYDFEGLSVLRKILSNEKARIITIIKENHPGSIYELAKILNRDFKSVNDDVKLLERFGFVDMIAEKTGKRERLKPVVTVDSMHIHIKL